MNIKYRLIGAITLIAVLSFLLSGCTVQRGTVSDKVFSVDNGVGWNHVYFVNDHTTTYCLDKYNTEDYKFLKDSMNNNGTVVKIDYEKNFLGRGAFCMGQGDNEKLVITKVYK